MPPKNDMKTYQSIVIGIVIGFLAGVGTMQASLVGDVRDHSIRITHIETESVKQMAQFEQRMDKLVRMLEALIETNRELLAALNAKNQNRP